MTQHRTVDVGGSHPYRITIGPGLLDERWTRPATPTPQDHTA